jgi:cyclic-di-AMP phosphodiesterase PgpH
MNSHHSKVAASRFLQPQPLSNSPFKSRVLAKTRTPLLLALTIASLTSAVGHRFYNQPSLAEGTIAPTTIIAPKTASFEDKQKTEKDRKKAIDRVIPILKKDIRTTESIKAALSEKLQKIELFRAKLTVESFVGEKILSLESQISLCQIPDAEWQTIKKYLIALPDNSPTVTLASATNISNRDKEAIALIGKQSQQLSADRYSELIAKIEGARRKYRQKKESLLQEMSSSFDRTTLTAFLDMNSATWTQTKTSIGQIVDRILNQGIPEGMPTKLMQEAISIQASTTVPKATVTAVENVLTGVLKPNLVRDEAATFMRTRKTAAEIVPATVSVKEGETIVREGEIISREDFLLLDSLHLSQRGINWWGLGLTAGSISVGTAFLWLVRRRLKIRLRSRDGILICLLSLSAPVLAYFHVPYNNLPAIGLLASGFYQPILAIAQVTLVGGLVVLSEEETDWSSLLAGISGGWVAAAFAWRMRSREAIAKLSLSIGIAQGGVYFIVKVLWGLGTGTIWYTFIPEALAYGFSGIAWSVVALGISPYLERFFDVVTPIRLAELSNPNLPLLKRLATEAPGTFQHTMFVASLSEAAARELNCNVELIRAGTLYHDIGKLHDPLAFIENQMGAPNKHEAIDDPWESAAIIKKHVSEGIEMAKKYGLPKAIRDFIPQHQGTLLIAYFYYQAKDKQGEEQSKPVTEVDFRYDGPIPQSREAGIMMLADCCEAALRSLKNATPEIALGMVHKIFKARWQERQLVDSGLRWEELPIIAEVFIKVWQQCNHQRIAYPKAALEPRKIEQDKQTTSESES